MRHWKHLAIPAVLACALLIGVPAADAYRYVTTTTRTVTTYHPINHIGIGYMHAKHIALRARPGRVVDHELIRTRGGRLHYMFDVKSGHRIYDVGIDARTGAVVENHPEGMRRVHRRTYYIP